MKAISKDDAQELVWLAIATQDVSKHRWYTRQLVIFEYEESLMGCYYLNPASEIQEDQERFESDPVEIFPVSAREVTTTVYERAE